MDKLVGHLKVLSLEKDITYWVDDEMQAGDDWRKKIEDALNGAEVAVLLISKDSLQSCFIRDVEVKQILSRHKAGKLWVFPILVKPCPWQAVDWLEEKLIRPRDGRPLSSFRSTHEQDAELSE